MGVGPLKKDVCKMRNKHRMDFKRNKQFKDLKKKKEKKMDYYGSRESKSIYSDTTVEVC